MSLSIHLRSTRRSTSMPSQEFTCPTSRMAGKRGRKGTVSESTGRPRGRPSKKRATGGTHPHGKTVDHEKDYKVRSIIDENDTQYYIDWEPDEESGEVYEPTWEPKENANSLAVRDWESCKAAAKKQKAASGRGSAAPPRRRGRSRKIVESSRPAESGGTATSAAVENQHTKDETVPNAPEIYESQQAQAENDEPLRRATTEKGSVTLSSLPSSHLAGEYQKVASRPTSKDEEPRPSQPVTSSASVVPQSTINQVATSTQKSTNSTSLVIPDSQSQGIYLRESTFRGFSPTQHTQRRQVESAIEELPQPAPQEAVTAVVVAEPVAPARFLEYDEQAILDPKVTATSQATDQGHGSPVSRIARPLNQTDLSTAGTASTARNNSIPEPGTTATATANTASSGFSSTDSSHSQDQNNGDGERQVVVISSIQDLSGPSASLNFDSSIHDTDFEPPPAAQRPLPSSAIEDPNPGPPQASTVEPSTQQQHLHTSQVETPIGLTQSRQQGPRQIHYYGSSQSFPFQTQIQQQTAPQKLESLIDHTYTPGSRALCMPTSELERSSESTPFPSLPRAPLGTIGESAPPRFSLSFREHPNMESSPVPKRETLAEKMKRSREARNAARASATPSVTSSLVNGDLENAQPASALPPNLIAEVVVAQAARLGSPFLSTHERSPSAVPAVEVVAPITREEMITSERYETLLPQAQNSSKAEPQQNGTGITSQPADKSQDASENPEVARVHVVPIAPSAFQRDQYQNNIYYEEKLIAQVLSTGEGLDDRILAKIDDFLQRLRKVALHPDLINPETLSQTTENEIQAKWDIKTSAKFEFLNEFIATVSDQNLHIAVAAHGERIPDMLQNFFSGIKVPCKRWAHPLSIDPDLSPANLGVKVSIIDLDGDSQNVEPADVVIAMDPFVDYRHPLVRAARKQIIGHQVKWSLLLTLVIPHTLEHIERSLQVDLPPLTRTRVLVKATNECRWNAGRLESTQAPLKHAAAAIADYLDDKFADWPIAGLSQLEYMDSQTGTDIQADSRGVKRPFDDAEADAGDEAKRVRLGSSAGTQLPVTINPLELDITHVSDSLEKGTQSNTDSGDSSLASSNTEQRLREILQGVQDHLDEHVKALEGLQYRHEDQRKHLVEIKKERDTALVAAQTALARMTGAEANNVALRTERTQLKEALAEANARLHNHEVPEIRELEEVRVSVQAAQLEVEKAKKKTAAAEKDLEWTRSMYQDSSNRARELARNNSELEARLAHATHIAQGEQARARDLSFRGHNKALEQDNIKLKATVENLKYAMKNKNEQIASLREGRGRMGTKGSSVPRSPRRGSPLKGRMSRQASPAGSEMKGRGAHLHPLRNSAGT